MKKSFFICFFNFFIYTSFAQTVDKYCQLTTSPKWKKGEHVNISFGEDSTLFSFKDKTIKKKALLVKNYSTTVDALNYLSSIGWTLVNSFPYIENGNTAGKSFYLKRTFDLSELDITAKTELKAN